VDRIDSLEIPLSSSEIRRTLAAGQVPIGLPPAVFAYAWEHRLYS
jgi:nicotinic acid mononucleotide adenylyltransferase